ncbi:DUF4249 domain-containing protein [Flagellimonas sp.]|uniref:DUF4249 domain-containing protein n=1 Tax=Flagellimonas sp. TaxID=2058762 RepID=UPI003B5B97BA
MIKLEATYLKSLAIMMAWLLLGCIEPFETEFVDFKDAFVVDAKITDEMKRQEIVLTRTYRFQDEGPPPEANASIMVKDNSGNEYAFEETDSGKYLSKIPFAASPQKEYHLSITTQNGKKYRSQDMSLPQESKIDTVYAKRLTNDLGEEGMAIFVSAALTDDANSFYRYEYEETYKVIAPRWAPRELEVIRGGIGDSIILVPRSLDERICYPSRVSNKILLADTEDFTGGTVSDFMVHFINRNDYIISHRYSILVRQHTHSIETASFLETLNNFSTNESLFSETQPGFLEGNIYSEQDANERILGYFDVSAVDEKRIFFNYVDFFPGERLPPYVEPCVENAPAIGLVDLIRSNLVKYVRENDGEFNPGGPHVTVPAVCGDCTILGTSEVPDFWIE